MASTAFLQLCLGYFMLLLSALDGAWSTAQKETDQAQILNCVASMASKDALGFITVLSNSSTAFALVTGPNKQNSNAQTPVIVGGRLGKGRIVAFSHDSFLYADPKSDNVSDRAVFVDNMLNWVSDDNPWTIHVLVYESFFGFGVAKDLMKTFKEKFSRATLGVEMPSTKVDVLVIQGEFLGSNVEKVKKHVEEGGGLVITANNWWFSKDFKDQEDFDKNWSVNQVVRDAGFTYQHGKPWNFAGELGKINELAVAIPKSEYRCERGAQASRDNKVKTVTSAESDMPPKLLDCDEGESEEED